MNISNDIFNEIYVDVSSILYRVFLYEYAFAISSVLFTLAIVSFSNAFIISK